MALVFFRPPTSTSKIYPCLVSRFVKPVLIAQDGAVWVWNYYLVAFMAKHCGFNVKTLWLSWAQILSEKHVRVMKWMKIPVYLHVATKTMKCDKINNKRDFWIQSLGSVRTHLHDAIIAYHCSFWRMQCCLKNTICTFDWLTNVTTPTEHSSELIAFIRMNKRQSHRANRSFHSTTSHAMLREVLSRIHEKNISKWQNFRQKRLWNCR